MTMDMWYLLWMNLIISAISLSSLTNGNLLSVDRGEEISDFKVFDKIDTGAFVIRKRSADDMQRDVIINSNITSYVTRLNTSHQQLLVHWSGMGSQVLICLAKNNQPLGYKQNPTPSALYISYDYGRSFVNRTNSFVFNSTSKSYASVDKFFLHKEEKKFIIFIDKFNKLLFTTKDYGKQITTIPLSFEPAEILTHPHDPWMFLVYDTKQKLRITRDFGQSFTVLQEMVKSYFWTDFYSPGKGTSSVGLVVQRIEPLYSTAIALTNISSSDKPQMKLMISNIEQILSNGDFMFAIRKISNKTSELFISYRGGEFLPTQFDSNLDKKSFHVTDASETRLMVAVSHTETLSNLYISEVEKNQNKYLFRLSLERLFCFFPNIMWLDSWLTDVAEGAFADIHKVQGMRGIFLASQVVAYAQTQGKNISPEHLTSVITYDWGGEWKPLQPPKVDMYGSPINCDLKKNCSLQVTQKFSYLYPVTRNVPILTSKSAPGIIIATGTVGPSLKGHVGVYVSRDAGLTWHHVLRENYLFNMGDHGGIFTAVKLYKNIGETFEVLYSFDEGETWEKFEFAKKPMRIYGLMTEPGENTTVFTIFGSEPEKHEWTIINIDFIKAFPINCSTEDYRMWSPSSSTGIKMSCIMGRKETYERRIRHTKCFNGREYDRPTKMEPCYCDIEDFECDYGFLRHLSSPDCIRNKTSLSDPYGVPDDCKPGAFYKRTKGYRKVDGDVCVGGLDDYYLPDLIPCPLKEPNQFLLLAQKENIIRFDMLDPKPVTLPINGLRNVIAIDYDMKNNCVYFADIVTDVIGRQCFSTGKQDIERLVESHLRSVEGIALDWISNLLYFVDGIKASIEVIRTDINHTGRMRATILDSKDGIKKPRGITLHPVRGYMFWTDWDELKPSVNRANLDGSVVKIIAQKPNVVWPNGITIDHISERIYWVDAKLDYIATSDLEGRFFRKILTQETTKRMHHPFSVAVFKDTIYWDDWTEDAVFMADKDHGNGIQPFAILYTGLMDVKVFGHSLQEGTNECDPEKKKCSHLCLALPGGYRCTCPDGMVMREGECLCANNLVKPYANGTCPKGGPAGSCNLTQFTCKNGNCIPKMWECDKDNDCGDNSDEENCEQACSPNFFDCGRGKCVPLTWKCDSEHDCEDGRDEHDCPVPVCRPEEFQCQNKRCINKRWLCDGENDCKDGSDEANCSSSTLLPPKNTSCTSSQFACTVSAALHCIPRVWVCDGEVDCIDKEDERDCEKNTCDPTIQIKCEKTHRCILKAYVCDGQYDCGPGDTTDEKNCTSPTPAPGIVGNNTCKGWMFRCENNLCIPSWWKCDGVDDCGDNSDEDGCTGHKISVHTTMPTPHFESNCKDEEFRCDNGACISQTWLCDGAKDCSNGEDELHCDEDGWDENESCPKHYFKCWKSNMICIPERLVCDGINHCPDKSDERSCSENQLPTDGPENPACASGFFACDWSLCLPLSKMCNNFSDCYDGTDEINCSSDINSRVFQVSQLEVDRYQVSSTGLTIFWWLAAANVTLQYKPSIAEIIDGEPQQWKNATWVSDHRFNFNKLLPATKHNITVYVQLLLNGTSKEFPPGMYITGTTAADLPSAPLNVKIKQIRDTSVNVEWTPPQKPNGDLTNYEVFIKPPTPPLRVIVTSSEKSQPVTHALVTGHFTHGQAYSVWVTATNEMGSTASDIVTFTADDASSVGSVPNFQVTRINDTAVGWTWDAVKGAKGYKVEVSADFPYPYLPTVTTNETHYYFTNLAPGVEYTFFICAYNKDFYGPKLAKGGRTSGDELPVVPQLTAQLANNSESSILLSWKPPKNTKYKEKWQYGIYYSTNSTDLFRGAKNVTDGLSMLVNGLGACEKYMVDIGLVGPLGQGPLTAAPMTVTTGNDPRAPPKRLRAVLDRHNDTVLEIMWSSSCFNMSERVGYVLSIKDEITGRTTSVTYLPTSKTEFKHRSSIRYGGRFVIRVQTDREGSRSSEPIIFVAPPLPTPHQIEAHPHKNDTSKMNIYWNLKVDKNLKIPPFSYEILMSEGKPLNESEAVVVPAGAPPYLLSDVKAGTVYYFAVRLVTDKGYRSAISEITSREIPLGAWASVMTPTRVMGIFVPICLVLIIVAGALAVFIIRHRRLQNNFTTFANSHYSTRSGAATFTTDGLDDEDSPVIRGFSDDEPLVVA